MLKVPLFCNTQGFVFSNETVGPWEALCCGWFRSITEHLLCLRTCLLTPWQSGLQVRYEARVSSARQTRPTGGPRVSEIRTGSRGFWLKRKTSSYTVHSSLVKATVFKVFSEQFRAVPHKGCHLAFLWTPRGDGDDRAPACHLLFLGPSVCGHSVIWLPAV